MFYSSSWAVIFKEFISFNVYGVPFDDELDDASNRLRLWFELVSDDTADVLGLSTGEMLELEFLKGAVDEYFFIT